MKISKVRATNWRSFADTGNVELADINLIIGRNNSGKSAFIHAIHLLQQGAITSGRDVRLGESDGEVVVELVGDNLNRDLSRHYQLNSNGIASPSILTVQFSRQGASQVDSLHLPTSRLKLVDSDEVGVGPIVAQEPRNFEPYRV